MLKSSRSYTIISLKRQFNRPAEGSVCTAACSSQHEGHGIGHLDGVLELDRCSPRPQCLVMCDQSGSEPSKGVTSAKLKPKSSVLKCKQTPHLEGCTLEAVLVFRCCELQQVWGVGPLRAQRRKKGCGPVAGKLSGERARIVACP